MVVFIERLQPQAPERYDYRLSHWPLYVMVTAMLAETVMTPDAEQRFDATTIYPGTRRTERENRQMPLLLMSTSSRASCGRGARACSDGT